MNQAVENRHLIGRVLRWALSMCLALGAASAGAVVVTFDDLSLSANDLIPDGYQGINWTTSALIDFRWFPTVSVDPVHAPPSSPASAYARNGFDGGPVSFHFVAPEIFQGAYFHLLADTCGVLCPAPVPLTVKFDLYLGGVLQGESATLSGNDDWQFLASGFAGAVDEVKIVKSNGQYAAFMDNLTYSNPVPEPRTWALLTAGLIGLCGLARGRLG